MYSRDTAQPCPFHRFGLCELWWLVYCGHETSPPQAVPLSFQERHYVPTVTHLTDFVSLPALKGKVADRRSDGRVSHFHFQLLTFNFKLWRPQEGRYDSPRLKKHFRRSAFFYNYLFFLASFSASFSALSCLAFSAFSASSLFCSSILAALSASYLDFDSSYFESSSSR